MSDVWQCTVLQRFFVDSKLAFGVIVDEEYLLQMKLMTDLVVDEAVSKLATVAG